MYFNNYDRVSKVPWGHLRAREQTYIGSVRDGSRGRHDRGLWGVSIEEG
jgi:hypothetical protein